MVIVYFNGGFSSLHTNRPMLHFLRGCLLVFANMMFFLGLANLPLAETVSLFYTAPLFICLLSQPFLDEKVGRTQWLIIMLGLLGVVIMLRPGKEVFNTISLFPVAAAFAYAGMTIMTRKLGIRDSANALTFYIQLAFIVISSMVGLLVGRGQFDQPDNITLNFLFRAWQWPDMHQLQLLMLCGAMVCCGGYLISQAYRLGQASKVAPFEYASLPFALLAGFYFWGDWPDAISFIGSGFIIFSGLLIAIIENRKLKAAKARV